MVNPYSRLTEFDRQLPGFDVGGPVDKKNIKIPEQKPILSREEKVKVDWKAVGKWLKDFHNQKHPFQKSTGKVYQPTKLDKAMTTILDPRKKASVIKNIAYHVGQRVAPDLIDKVQSYFSTDNISALDKYIEQQKQTISPHGYKGMYEPGEKSLRKLVNKINTEFIEPVDPSKDIFKGTDLENILENNRAVISKNNLIDDSEIAKNFSDYMSQRKGSATVKTEKEYNAVMEKFLNKIKPIENQQNDPLLLRDLLTESWKETTGKDVITSSAQAKKLDKTMTKNQWRRFYNKFIERNPQYEDIPFSKFEFDKQQVNSKINELIEQGIIPPSYATETKQAALFYGALKESYSDLLPVKGRLYEGTMARYLNFIRRTRTDLIDPINDPSYKKFFSIYNPNELNIPGSKFYKDYQKFTKLDNKRAELSKLLQPILKKLSPEDSKFSIQIAHKFESSQIGDAVSQTKLGKGGDAGEMYLDLSSTNISKQTKLEERARNLQKLLEDTENPEYLIEIAAIDTIMRDLGVEGQVVSPIVDRLGNVVAEPGFTLGQAETNLIRKIINIAEANKIRFSEKDKVILRKAYNMFQQKAEGGMVQSMKDGGIVQYFKDGTDQEGVTADQGSISGIDVKPYIPPHLRMSEDKLTVGDIGTGISEAAETMWPYMVPGVGEYLSAKDYEMFSQQAEEAWGKGEYPSWLGATILGSVALGGTVPNWTVVGAVPNLALGAYKGIKKAITPTPTKIAKKPIVEMEKRYVIKDEAGNKVFQAKSIDDAEQKVLVLKDKEGKNFTIEEINIPKKVKKTKQEVVHVPTVEATDVIGSGNNRLFYSKMDQYMQGTNGNIRVKIGGSGSSVDIPINEAKLSAKEWHDSFRAAGVKESELVDSYIRQYLNKKGVFKDGKFTNNQPIAYAEIKELFDGSPSRFVQSSKYSDADGNLKYGDGGRSKGYKDGTREEHVLWMDSKDIRGDVQELPSNIARYEGHRDIRKVETDANFSTNNKLEGEPYVIGWSLVDDRPGILANKKNVTVTTATEIQSDFLQKAASLKANLKKDLKTNIQAGNTSTVKEITQKLENIFRQMPLTSAEIKGYTSQIEQASKVFDDVAKMDLNLVDDAVMRQLDEAAALRDEALAGLNKFIDDIDPKDLFPNIPFKDQKDWVSSLIKNDVAIAAQKRFYFDENGVLQVNKNAPSHYSVAPSVTQKNRWMQSSMRDNPDIGMNTPPNMRSTREHGQAVAYDLEYGGPNVYAPDTWQVVDESKIIKDIDGKIVRYEDGYVVSKGHPRIVSAEGVLNKMVDDGLSIENIKIEKVKTHFTSNSEATLRKIASEKNAEFSIGKVKHGNEMVESYLIELTPEMLTPFAQYFKHGGLVEKIPQYNPLQSVLDVLGPIGAY